MHRRRRDGLMLVARGSRRCERVHRCDDHCSCGHISLEWRAGADTGDLDLTKPVTIVGAAKPSGAAATSIVGSGDRIVDLAATATTVTLRGVRLSGGNAGNNSGGGIRTATGTNLTLVESTVTANSAKEGAGVHNSGTLLVDRSTLSANTSSGKGGGLFNAGTATVRNSTINGNTAGGGGGIASSGSVLIAHSNITDNNSNNSNGGGIYRVGGAFTLKSSIIADNNAPTARDCYGTPTFQGINLVENTPGCTPVGTVIQLDPALDPLADNGGPTLTQMLRLGSPAIDATPCDPAIVIDQRNIARPSGAACDLGAVELAPLSFSLSLAATPAQVNVGVQTVPISNIPTSVLATAYPASTTSSTADTALARIALARIALARIDVENTALARIALARIMLDDIALARISLADTALARILITEVDVDGGWEALLLGSASAGVPLQTLTMADVLADPVAGPRLQALDLTKLDVDSTLLGEIPLVLFAFAGQTYNTLTPDSASTVPALDQWAAILGVPAADLSGRTPLSTALARIDVTDAAIARIALAASMSTTPHSPAPPWPASIWATPHSPASPWPASPSTARRWLVSPWLVSPWLASTSPTRPWPASRSAASRRPAWPRSSTAPGSAAPLARLVRRQPLAPSCPAQRSVR